MNKFKALVLVSCVMSFNAIAQTTVANPVTPTPAVVPAESFKPGAAAQATAPVVSTLVAPNIPQNAPQVVAPSVSVSGGVSDIQVLSAQSNEEYMQRRNNTFKSELSKCIDELPKDARGLRKSEDLIKCANSNKSQAPVVNQNISNPSYLSDLKASPETKPGSATVVAPVGTNPAPIAK